MIETLLHVFTMLALVLPVAFISYEVIKEDL